MDDFDINVINEALGLPPKEDSAADEKVGEERLGTGSVNQSFGATLILGSILFLLLILVILLVIFIYKRINLSDKAKERVKNLKAKVFWNPIIRYLILNSLKLSMTAFVAFKVTSATGDIASSVGLVIVVNFAPIAFYLAVWRNQKSLKQDDTQKVLGSIYMGKNIDKIGH